MRITSKSLFRSRLELDYRLVIILIAIFLLTFYNHSMWLDLINLLDIHHVKSYLIFASFGIFFTCLFGLILTFISFRPIFKLLTTLIFFCSATAAYFMDTYGVTLDRGMMQNIFQTDPHEAIALISLQFIVYIVLLGVLPSLLLALIKVNYPKKKLSSITQRLGLSIAFLAIAIIQAGIFYSYYSSIFRDHREVLHTANPSSYISASIDYLRRSLKDAKPNTPAQVIDASPTRHAQTGAPPLMIFVVGETARADHFSLNGYEKNTNPLLSQQQGVFNFKHVSSCGTSTAVSVPCMFSMFPRTNYDDAKGKDYENALDILHRAGVNVFWRDNNSDCKGVCVRLPNETPAQLRIDKYCDSESCLDEVLMTGLDKMMTGSSKQPTMLVLHVMGSHGPKYHARTPGDMKKYVPECLDNVLGNCKANELNNAYDNTIVYTDFFLNRLITMLQKEKRPSTLFYVSDHGESLGENGMYLHGAPYLLAPVAQTHVPMMLWMNLEQQQALRLNTECLAKQQDNSSLSHDNIFHTLLGLFQVKSKVYEANLDILASCRG